MYGHWVSKHAADGSLLLTVKSTNGPSEKVAGRDGGGNKKVLEFNLAKLTDNHTDEQPTLTTITDLNHGEHLDDSAPYAILGTEELQTPAPTIWKDWSGTLDLIPKNFDRFTHWQYGSGQHSSAKKKDIWFNCAS